MIGACGERFALYKTWKLSTLAFPFLFYYTRQNVHDKSCSFTERAVTKLSLKCVTTSCTLPVRHVSCLVAFAGGKNSTRPLVFTSGY